MHADLIRLAHTAQGRAGLRAVLADPGRALLAVDYDGTLAPIVADPTLAWPSPGVVDRLCELSGRLAGVLVLTGRPAAEVVGLAGLDRPQACRLRVAGQYGRETWDGATGQLLVRAAASGVEEALARLPGILDRSGLSRWARVEPKGSAVAVHLRGAPDPDGALLALGPALAVLAEQTGLVVQPGRLVLELRSPGTDKGQSLVEEAQRCHAGSVLMVGDDLGDLAAFGAVGQLRARGVPGVCVASASAEAPEVAAGADVVLDGPPGVADFLRTLSQESTAT
ncbi:MAG: trehalose-phosphatase [Actinomycetes bacterium]